MSNLLGKWKEIHKYRLLWVHVIKQAYRDMTFGKSNRVRRLAFKYIFVPNRDFDLVSSFLNIRPEQLRERLVKAFLNKEEI